MTQFTLGLNYSNIPISSYANVFSFTQTDLKVYSLVDNIKMILVKYFMQHD